MEKRDICKSFFVSKSEAEKLHKNADRCGMTEGEYVRYLINGINPKESLPKDFHSDMEGINRIGRDISQMTRLALANGYVGANEITLLQDMMKQVNNIYESILDKIMEPETFKVPGCESMIKDIDVSGLLDELE